MDLLFNNKTKVKCFNFLTRNESSRKKPRDPMKEECE
jgi:hypothetical protein